MLDFNFYIPIKCVVGVVVSLCIVVNGIKFEDRATEIRQKLLCFPFYIAEHCKLDGNKNSDRNILNEKGRECTIFH